MPPRRPNRHKLFLLDPVINFAGMDLENFIFALQ